MGEGSFPIADFQLPICPQQSASEVALKAQNKIGNWKSAIGNRKSK
jgi:hypothetical protein